MVWWVDIALRVIGLVAAFAAGWALAMARIHRRRARLWIELADEMGSIQKLLEHEQRRSSAPLN